jgi:selenocysteine-specific elongation factor
MELADGTFLEGKPVIRFSSLGGSGSNEAMVALDLIIAKIKKKQPDKPFRLWIDQVRGFPGIGTVVSGTVLPGAVKLNDELQILPDEISIRVRSLEEHGRKIDAAVAGQRIGLNLHIIGLADIRRGMCLVQPGKFMAASRFNIEMQSLRHTGETTIKDRQKVKLYLGTSAHNATIKFISPIPPEKDGRSLVQLQLKKLAAVAGEDHFVVSPLNRNTIIAGGRVLELAEGKIREANKSRTIARLNALTPCWPMTLKVMSSNSVYCIRDNPLICNNSSPKRFLRK